MIGDRCGSLPSESNLPRFVGPRWGYREHLRRLNCTDRAQPRLTCVLPGYNLAGSRFRHGHRTSGEFCSYWDPPRLTLPILSLSPLCSRTTTGPATMRSLFLVLTALPLASFALVINHANNEVEGSAHKNGTASNRYRLQHKHQGATFFEYVKAQSFFYLPR